MSDFSSQPSYRWTNCILYFVEDDLQRLFETVLARYEQMKRTARCNGESEEQLLVNCRKSMEQMRMIYQKNLPKQTKRVDFSDHTAQWSYMYLYMLRHVHLVYYALNKAIQENVLRMNPNDCPIDVCMIGGGPGSDILGISLLMKEYKCRTPWTNRVFVLDACTQWEFSWEKMYNLLPERFRQGVPEVNYYPFNYRENNLSKSNQERIKNAEVVTMIKSLSSAAAWLKNQEKVYHDEKYIRSDGTMKKKIIEWHSVYSVLKHMQPGAILLYLDNKTGWQREVLMKAAKYRKMEVLLDLDLQDVRMPTSFLTRNREFSKKIEWKPCSVAGDNEMIILRKPGDLSYKVKLEVTAVPNPSLSKGKRIPQSAVTNESVYDHLHYKRNAEYAKYLEKGRTSFDDHGCQNSRVPSQEPVTRGMKIVEGIDGIRMVARNSSKTPSQTSVSAAPSTDNLKDSLRAKNPVRRDSTKPSQTCVAVTKATNRMDGTDSDGNLARYNHVTRSQTPSTAMQGAYNEEGIHRAARGHARHSANIPPFTPVSMTRGGEEYLDSQVNDRHNSRVPLQPPAATETRWDRFVHLALRFVVFCCPIQPRNRPWQR
ncbi:hypothetical protein HOLleu_26100 [Holothuria leucospilota]|uniref:Uncharacterized protein n=1 Tax=Holothuria leucospilota TaxID=206669 RepID=A0A9Q1H3Z8_HOLLE|nr:hypothetical protein HOLleu_26100 [Holothuria leucospilota]